MHLLSSKIFLHRILKYIKICEVTVKLCEFLSPWILISKLTEEFVGGKKVSLMFEKWSDSVDSSEIGTGWNAVPSQNRKILKWALWKWSVHPPPTTPPPPSMTGDEKRLTEAFFTSISEDSEKEWLLSVVLRANKDFLAVEPTPRDKCLTEGYSPSCMILMICSRHIPISLVVHEALWHTQCSGLLVWAILSVGPPFFCMSQWWNNKKYFLCWQNIWKTHRSHESLDFKRIINWLRYNLHEYCSLSSQRGFIMLIF